MLVSSIKRQSHEGSEGKYKYSSTISFTSALVGGQRHTPSAVPPGMTRYPMYRRLSGSPGPVWNGAENLSHTNTANHFEYRVVCCVVYIPVTSLGWCITRWNGCVCCPFNNGRVALTSFPVYFKRSLILSLLF
jgi:hypothetical protein